MKKILLFTYAGVGGAERVTVTIAKMLRKAGHDARIVLVYKKGQCQLTEFIPADMPVIHMPVLNIWAMVSARIAWLLRREKADAVFSSNATLNLRVINGARLAGVPCIVVRNQNMMETFHPLTRIGMKLIYPMAQQIVLQSEEMQREFNEVVKSVDPSHTHALVNPVDTDTIDTKVSDCANPYDEGHTDYVFVGRVTHTKGIDVLLDAFRRVKDKVPDARLNIVGRYSESDPYYQGLKEQMERLGLGDSVVFHGFTNNPYRFVKYANCFVLPSRIEGLPNVVLEAMYLGVPAVATRSVPIVDRLVPSERGIVVDVEDVDGLADAMIRALLLKVGTPYLHRTGDFINLFA